jgi:hypothetical protein
MESCQDVRMIELIPGPTIKQKIDVHTSLEDPIMKILGLQNVSVFELQSMEENQP